SPEPLTRNAVANPSLTRLEAKKVPAANSAERLIVSGIGEPAQVIGPRLGSVAESAGCVKPPMINGLLTGGAGPAQSRSGRTAADAFRSCAVAARTPEMRRANDPETGTVTLMPLKTMMLPLI